MNLLDTLHSERLSLSFEVFPPKTDTAFESVKSATEEIARLHPAFMSVTYGAGGGTSKYTLEIAKNIKETYGVSTLAHLTCVSSTKETVKERIRAIKTAGIKNVMALRGDIPEEKKNEEKSKKQPKSSKKSSAPQKKRPGGNIQDFQGIIREIIAFLGTFRRKLIVRNLQLHFLMAGGDPADLARNYGYAWAAVGNLVPQLERVFYIKKRAVSVDCDFLAEQRGSCLQQEGYIHSSVCQAEE